MLPLTHLLLPDPARGLETPQEGLGVSPGFSQSPPALQRDGAAPIQDKAQLGLPSLEKLGPGSA